MPKKVRMETGRIFEGYASFINGAPLWPTFRATREDALETAERFNPSVSGYPPPVQVLPVRVSIDLNRQKDMEDVWRN